MPTQDEQFIDRLRATFKVEADEHLQAIAAMLLELEKSPGSSHAAATVENVYREAHSLKGAARAVDYSEIEAICQALESTLAGWKREQFTPSPEAFDALHRAVDTIEGLLAMTESAAAGGGRQRSDEIVRLLGGLHGDPRPAEPVVSRPLSPVPPEPISEPPAPTNDTEKAPAAETVRIAISKLDARLLEAEDMLTVKAIVSQRARQMRDFVGQFTQWRKEWAKVSAATRGQTAGAPAALLNFLDWNSDYLRALENKLMTLAAQSEQDRHGVGKRVDDLLEDSKKLLMLPFSTLAGGFPKLIRDLCREQDKEAELTIRGGDVEIDKRILEDMKDVLTHVLRNCVDHGVEKSAERIRLGKPPRAAITIAASQTDGNKVEILVCDDGGGVNVERVKQSAVRHGIISQSEAGAMGDAEAMTLIFHSDVSTSPIITAISGRGLGMAIVRAKTEKLGGHASVESNRGAGMSLRMVLPLTLATFRGILVSAGDRTFVVPSISVERVVRIKSREIQTVENRETVSLRGRPVSLARLEAVLGLASKARPAGEEATIPVLLLHFAEQRIAFAVDEVLHEEEVLVKPLRKPLVRVRNIAGATVLGSGRVVPILNVADLMISARKAGIAPTRAVPEIAAPPTRKKVLVVEDSVTSRMLLKGILESGGYTVRTAVDGVEAYATLRQDDFNLVVSDVEMPRMNGFDLTAKMRADKRLADLPVVLVTGLESKEQRERGIDAGANAYVVKSSFDQQNLLEVIRKVS